jgi:4-carboxymuconolactone decarboxylase
MTGETDALGGRLPLLDPAAFTGAQRQLFDTVTATRERRANDAGFRITTPDHCGLLIPKARRLSGSSVDRG